MSVVTIEYYRLTTGDQTSAASAIEPFLDESQQMIEEALGRRLSYGVYTERLKLWPNALVYPAAVPIESVPASANGEVYDESTLMNVSADDTPWLDWRGGPDDWDVPTPVAGRRGSDYEGHYWYATVTYVGGFTFETLPIQLRKSIVRLARALTQEYAPGQRQPGTGMVRVGDVQVNYRGTDIEAAIDQYVPGMSKRIKSYHLGRL